jgi:5-methylcytosine-specific restriction protein A
MDEVYGSCASKIIHAHHLKPLASLENDSEIELNVHKDFAVLCPNCHAVIHKMPDVSDLEALRSLIAGTSKTAT